MHYNLPPLPELDYQIVMDALKGYAYPRKALSDVLKRGELLRIKRGLYVQSGPGISPYSREILANMIYGPSYISFEYALAFYSLIPERVEEVTSVTTGKSKQFNTPGGKFSYRHIPSVYYSFGFSRKKLSDERAFLIAEPEKAVADRVLQEKGRFSVSSMRQFLFENLRMDSTEFRKLNIDIFDKASKLTGRQSLEILRKVRMSI
jgi:hypothetical protein